MDSPAPPLIVGFVADLMFATRISGVAERLGYAVRWIEDAADLPGAAGPTDEGPGELLEGQSGALFERLTSWQPALLIFDLDNAKIPWQRWIAALKSSPPRGGCPSWLMARTWTPRRWRLHAAREPTAWSPAPVSAPRCPT